MAITINGSGTITGVSAGGLPDGSVTADDLASTLDISGKTVTLPSDVGGITTGKVLQVVTGTTSTQASIGGPTYASTNLSASITPSSTSNKILIMVSQPMQATNNTTDSRTYGWRLVRGSTVILTQTQHHHEEYNINYAPKALGIGMGANYLDSPSTTSSTTYSTQFNVSATVADGYVQYTGTTSTIILVEIAG